MFSDSSTSGATTYACRPSRSFSRTKSHHRGCSVGLDEIRVHLLPARRHFAERRDIEVAEQRHADVRGIGVAVITR